MNKHIPCESDLTSSIPETWAKAVMCCKTGNPYCGADGYCHIGGECFDVKELTLKEALEEIQYLNKELDETRVRCNQIEALHSSLLTRLEHSKNIALKEGKSERVFAIRQTLAILERGNNANS
ncbi:MAG: hypothetical protein RSC68_21195 [Acinetobacter sp.]